MAKMLQNIYDLRPNIEDSRTRQQRSFPEIIEEDFWEAFETAKPFSMIHITGFYNLYQSISYIATNSIPGDFVECGALLGGSSIFITILRDKFGLSDRTVHVYDTFAGFPDGSVDSKRGILARGPRHRSFFQAVVANFKATCGTENVQFHVGPVEETLPQFTPDEIALLRLDTDFYKSTAVELEMCFPSLSLGGILIVDDYGLYDGSRRATDEYFDQRGPRLPMFRVDAGVWAGVRIR